MTRVLRVLLAAALIAPAPASAQRFVAKPLRVSPTPALSAAVRPSAPQSAPSAAASASPLAPALAAPAPVPAAVPALAAQSVAAPAAAAAQSPVSALDSLRALPAAAESAPSGFDGEAARAELAAEAAPAEIDRSAKKASEDDDIALWYTRADKKAIEKDQVHGMIRPIFGGLAKPGQPARGSQWFWDKFEKGAEVSIKVAGQTQFVTKVVEARSVRIEKLTREDFAGYYTAASIRGKSVVQLRKRLLDELNARSVKQLRGLKGVITPDTYVRVIKTLPYSQAKELKKNKDEVAYEPLPRREIVLPAALQGVHKMLPKAVFIDMREFTDAVPYALVEDISKLMKAGVYFIFLSDKPNEGPGSIEDLLTRGLTAKQRDQIARYKMITLSDEGNAISMYDGQFPRFLPTRRFSGQEQELMLYAAELAGVKAEVSDRGTRFTARAEGDLSALARLTENMTKLGLPTQDWDVRIGGNSVQVRPFSLYSAIPSLLETLRERADLYVLPSDIMTISRDGGVLEALNGSVQPARHLESKGEEFVDASLAAMLGAYRENRKGDLAASASKLSSFKRNPSGGGMSDGGNIYMLLGHVMHASFNWALWKYRQDGVLPSADETIEVSKAKWKLAMEENTRKLLDRPGQSLAGFYEVMLSRMRTMHEGLAEVMKSYPIVVGTELPNLHLIERFKKGEFEHRDAFRFIFDVVLAQKTADDALKLAIVDFKTGQTPVLQSLEKDVQVQLYDKLVRELWPQVALPYGGNGALKSVADYSIIFIYPPGPLQPILDGWSRLAYDKYLRNAMNRIRKHNAPAPKKDEKAAPKKKGKAASAPKKREK